MEQRTLYVIRRISDGKFLEKTSFRGPRFNVFKKARLFTMPHHTNMKMGELGEGYEVVPVECVCS